METKVKLIYLMVFMALLLIPKQGKTQQCNYQINNGTQCTIVVTVDFVDVCGATPTICDTQTKTCPPGGTAFNCNGCGTLCDVIVTVSGYTPVDNVTYYSTSLTNQTAPCSTSGCGSNKIDILWMSASTDISCAP